jgi:hypothetical protein
MTDQNKCPMCDNPVNEADEGFYCPTCDTEFSKVGDSAYLINHIGNYSVSELLAAVQNMIGSHQSIHNLEMETPYA